MTLYQFVTGAYDGDTGHINIWVRSESGEKKMFRISNFDPYLYVLENESVPQNAPWIKHVETGYISKDGDKLKKVIVQNPLNVSEHRDNFSKHFEADILFVERMLIDTGVKSSFYYDGESTIIPAETLKPANAVLQPLIVYMDIETKTPGIRFPNKNNPTQPVICVTFWDNKSEQYITFVVDDRYVATHIEQREENWKVVHVSSYLLLVDYIQKYFNYLKPDIVTGWNIRFDTDYFDAWAKKHFNQRIDWSPTEIFDLHSAYTKTRPNLGNRLKEVVIREGVIRQEDMVSEFFRIDTYLDPKRRDEFILYNKMDVDYCVKLDRGFKDVNTGEWKEYRFIQSFWGEKNFVGLHDINFTLEHIKRHDCLWLRKAHELGMVLPSAPEEQSEEDLEYGGVVFTPPPRIYPNLVVLDMSRYYPSILRSYPMQTSPDIWGKLGPAVINYLLAEREVWDAELLKHEPGTAQYKVVKDTRDKVKTFLSGSWGYFAFKGSRIFSKEKADFVLKTAGDGLHRLERRAESMGFKVVYGDSVSDDTPVFVRKNGRTEYIPIEDLYGGPKTNSWSHYDVKNTHIYTDDSWSEIEHIFRHKVKKKMYGILTRESYVECSEDHSLIVNGKEILPKTLQVGDKVDLIKCPILGENITDPDISWLVGFYLAEGTCGIYRYDNGLKYSWKISNQNLGYLEHCKDTLLNKLGLNTKIIDILDSSGVYALVPLDNHKVFVELFSEWCHTKLGRKKIPSFVLNGNQKQSFIDGLWCGDGNTERKTKIKNISLTDKCIVAGVCQILKSINVMYSLSLRDDKTNVIRLRIIRNKSDKRLKESNMIKKIRLFESDEFIYDIETQNHHFTGGVGNVLLHNTDSIFIDAPMERVPELETAMNEELQKWAEENGIGETAKFKIKEDRYASESLFIKKKGKETGAKKRYAQRIVREDGRACDYILIKGFDYIRGNTSEVTRKLQKECIEMVLHGKAQEFVAKLGKLMADIRGGSYDLDQIAIPVNLGLNFNKKDAGGEYYDGAIWANKYVKEEIVPGDLVKYFRVKSVADGSWESTKWCSYLDKQSLVGKGIVIDYDWVIERTIRSPLERILEAAGIGWENVLGYENLNEWFG